MRLLLLFVFCLQTILADSLTETPVLSGTLENGMNYYVKENSHPKGRAFLQVVFKVGSIHEEEHEQGIAHFLEHLNFRGSEHFDEQELAKYLESIGAHILAHNQASTSFERTEYHLDIPIDKEGSLDTALLFFKDFAGKALLSEEGIEKERHVVLDEMRRGFSSSGRRWYHKYFESHFPESVYTKRFPIGSEEVISTVSAETLRTFYKKWYRPDRMAFIAIGDFEGNELVNKIQKIFGDIVNPKDQVTEPNDLLDSPEEGLQVIHFDPELDGTSLLLTFVRPHEDHTSLSLREIVKKEGLEECVAELLSGRLEARSEEGIFRGFEFDSDAYGSLDLIFISTDLIENKLEDGLRAVFTELNRLKMYGFTEGELQRWKNETKLDFEQLIANLDKMDHEFFLDDFFDHFLGKGDLFSISEVYPLIIEFIDQLTVEQLNASLSSSFLNEVCTAFLSTPSSNIQKGMEGKNIFSFGDEDEFLEPFVDRNVEFDGEPNYAHGFIQDEKIDENNNITEWTLSNGIKVYLKKTDLAHDNVSVVAIAKGGLSMFSEDDYPSAVFSLWGLDGVKELSSYELALLLRSKGIEQAPTLMPHLRSLEYASDNNGLETVFQVIHAVFTEPRFDPQSWEKIFSLVDETLKQSENSPSQQFNRFIHESLSGHHFSSKIPDLSQVSQEKAKEAFWTLFGNPADFQLHIVGDFDIDQIRSLAKKYIASLPIEEREEERPLFLPTPLVEKVERDFVRGDQAFVECHLNIPFDLKSVYVEHSSSLPIRGAVRLIRDQLWKVLRTDLGKTYGVQVFYDYPFFPNLSTAYLKVLFTCLPEDRQLMVDLVLKELDAFKQYVPTEEEIVKIKALFAEERKEQSQSNSYWAEALRFSQLFGVELGRVVDPTKIDRLITPHNMQAAFQVLLQNPNYSIFNHLPEN